MRKNNPRSDIGRWDWYASGDQSSRRQVARGSEIGREDNSPEQVLWECGLVLVVPLACAVLVEVLMKLSGT
jgi:hypothetical protein